MFRLGLILTVDHVHMQPPLLCRKEGKFQKVLSCGCKAPGPSGPHPPKPHMFDEQLRQPIRVVQTLLKFLQEVAGWQGKGRSDPGPQLRAPSPAAPKLPPSFLTQTEIRPPQPSHRRRHSLSMPLVDLLDVPKHNAVTPSKTLRYPLSSHGGHVTLRKGGEPEMGAQPHTGVHHTGGRGHARSSAKALGQDGWGRALPPQPAPNPPRTSALSPPAHSGHT